MSKRKRPLPDEGALQARAALAQREVDDMWERVTAPYDPSLIGEALNALNSPHRGEQRAFDRAMDALESGDDETTVKRLVAAWLEPYVNELVGEQRRAGDEKRRKSLKGNRNRLYA